MLLHAATTRTLDLPPPYRLVTLREVGDAAAHARAVAAEHGAGTLVWVPRFDMAEFAVVLEPEEPLEVALEAFYVGMNALAAALATHAPPDMPISFDWPDAIRIDGTLVGGARLDWPAEARDGAPPDWMVLSAMIRTSAIRGGDPGLRPGHGALDELGFGSVAAGDLVASFARHLMAGFHEWREEGFAPAARRFREGLPRRAGAARDPIAERRSLREALAAPSWLDPATGTPWL